MSKILEEVCKVKGHNLRSQPVKQIVEPMQHVVVTVFEYRCTQCMKTKDEIEKYRPSGPSGKKKPKNGNQRSSDTRSTREENSEAAQPVAVESPSTDVLEPGVRGDDETASGTY